MVVRTWTVEEFAAAWGRSSSYTANCCAGRIIFNANGHTESIRHLPDGFTAEKISGKWIITGDDAALPVDPIVTIYFLQEQRGSDYSIKIGLTSHETPAASGGRFYSIGNGNWRKPKLIAALIGDRSIERDLHKRFRHLRLDREWFKPDWQLIEHINDIRRNFPNAQPTTEPKLPN